MAHQNMSGRGAAVDKAGNGLSAFSNHFAGSVRALPGILDCAPSHDKKREGNP